MTIISPAYKWNGALKRRSRTDSIVLHHCGGSGMSAEAIHAQHVGYGWAGIGYHWYVRFDGGVYSGRPEDTVGAHAGASSGYNLRSIGVCFEGNFEQLETMPEAQLLAGKELLEGILSRWDIAEILGHRDLTATACPGKYFPKELLQILPQSQILPEKNDAAAGMLNSDNEAKTEGKADMIVYDRYDEVPQWGRDTVKKLLDRGAIVGDEKGELSLSYEMLRILVINDRMGLYS